MLPTRGKVKERAETEGQRTRGTLPRWDAGGEAACVPACFRGRRRGMGGSLCTLSVVARVLPLFSVFCGRRPLWSMFPTEWVRGCGGGGGLWGGGLGFRV